MLTNKWRILTNMAAKHILLTEVKWFKICWQVHLIRKMRKCHPSKHSLSKFLSIYDYYFYITILICHFCFFLFQYEGNFVGLSYPINLIYIYIWKGSLNNDVWQFNSRNGHMKTKFAYLVSIRWCYILRLNSSRYDVTIT